LDLDCGEEALHGVEEAFGVSDASFEEEEERGLLALHGVVEGVEAVGELLLSKKAFEEVGVLEQPTHRIHPFHLQLAQIRPIPVGLRQSQRRRLQARIRQPEDIVDLEHLVLVFKRLVQRLLRVGLLDVLGEDAELTQEILVLERLERLHLLFILAVLRPLIVNTHLMDGEEAAFHDQKTLFALSLKLGR